MKTNTFNLLVFIALISWMSCERETVPIPDNLIEFEETYTAINDTYIIRIHLPESYHSSDLIYPVLYQLDGSTTTGSVIEDYEHLVKDNLTQEFIIVSIDYKNEDNRSRDFTPSSLDNFDNSGGANDFLYFLRHQLVPKINTTYRTDLSFGNTLRGHSLGGLFASYALFKANEADNVFSNFIIESPAWWWDDNYMIEMEYNLALNNQDLPFQAYFSAGDLEGATMKGSFEVIKERLLGRSYPNFRSKFEMLSNQNHLDVRENPNGLVYIFGL